MRETFASRWKRRAVTISVMLGATLMGVLTAPVTVPSAAVADLVRCRWRLPTVRVLLFLIQYGLNDSAEIVLAPAYWVLAGFGTRLDGRPSIDRHQRLQAWSLALLARRADRLLGLRIEIDDDTRAALSPSPSIVLCRHVSIVDASIPALIYQRLGYRTRGVIMAELLADPGFDLLYGRTGSVFIPRDSGPEAQSLIAELTRPLGSDTVTVLFPEGQLFGPERRVRSLARLAGREPTRAAMLAGLRHVLPPRPGGFLALLDALPSSDVVVIGHSGLEAFPTFKRLAVAVPLASPVGVTAWRTSAANIPEGREERTAWLDSQWQRLDDWCESKVVNVSPPLDPRPDR